MKRIASLILSVMALMLPSLAGAQTATTERWVEEWDRATQSWVRVSDTAAEQMLASATVQPSLVTTTTYEVVDGVDAHVVSLTTTVTRDAARYQAPYVTRPTAQALAQYGPFTVLDQNRAAMMGSTDVSAPVHFKAMLRDFPKLETLEMVEAPGTSHDLANLEVGRLIRKAGLSTHVPAGGSVRSGAVELFLAGATRTMDDRAEFAVHSWRDAYGREPSDFAEDAPENRLYLDYYVEMGMSETRARDFYAMTNSVPHHGALWLDGDEMRMWVKEQRAWDVPAEEPLKVALPAIAIEHFDLGFASAAATYLAAL